MVISEVLLVVQPQILGDGIGKILAEETNFNVSHTTGDIKTISDLPVRENTILVLDLDIADLNPLEIVIEQTESCPKLNILGIGSEENPKQIKNIIKMGASGFLFKNRGADELIRAINEISAGKTYLCKTAKEMVEKPTQKLSIEGKELIELTKRELEVLVLICNELTNPDISEKLNISVRTVDAHRRNILQKTGAQNTAGMVKYAIKNKIYSP